MPIYRKRNRDDSAAAPDGKKMNVGMQEKELVLKLKKNELFDPYVLLPHAELNEAVYKSVNAFVEKYRGDSLTLTILSGPASEAVQNTFREVYRAHYTDEYNKVDRYLKRRICRSFVLLFLSLTAFILGDRLTHALAGYNVFLNVIVNVGAFCLWEVGYTQFVTRDAAEEKKRIERALDAEIVFY